MNGEPLVLSTPSPSYIALGAQVIRILLFALSGAGLTGVADITDSQIIQLVSSATFLGTFAWSLWRTFAASRREHKIAQINNESMSGPPVQPAKVPV